MIMEHYLEAQPWKPDFDPYEDKISTLSAWVRIPKFPVDYYERNIVCSGKSDWESLEG